MELKEFKEKLQEELKVINLNINKEKIKKLFEYMRLVLEWNKKINLTAITDEREFIIKHFVDSLTISKYCSIGKIIDIGTGAGFPGIPLKIYNDSINITLLDSLKKRINFLDEVIEKLELNDIYTIHGRAEDIANLEENREKYDLVVSRAVAPMNVLLEYMLPFVKIRRAMYMYERIKYR